MSGGKPRQEEGDDPFSQFDFLVDFGGGLEGGFQEMSGLGLAGPGQVALKRGAIAGSAWLWDWHRAGRPGAAGSVSGCGTRRGGRS